MGPYLSNHISFYKSIAKADSFINCNTCTQDICYGSIPPFRSDTINPSIPSKPRLCARFGLIMMKYAFTSPPTKIEVKGEEIH